MKKTSTNIPPLLDGADIFQAWELGQTKCYDHTTSLGLDKYKYITRRSCHEKYYQANNLYLSRHLTFWHANSLNLSLTSSPNKIYFYFYNCTFVICLTLTHVNCQCLNKVFLSAVLNLFDLNSYPSI